MFPEGVTGMSPMHPVVREGFLAMERNNPKGALGLVAPLLEKQWAFPGAHFIAGNACMALVQMGLAVGEGPPCSVAQALLHLRLSALGAEELLSPDPTTFLATSRPARSLSSWDAEPPLPNPMRSTSLRMWLTLAAATDSLGDQEAFEVITEAVRIDDGGHGPTLFLWASWIPKLHVSAAAADAAWAGFDRRCPWATRLGPRPHEQVGRSAWIFHVLEIKSQKIQFYYALECPGDCSATA